MEPAGGPSQPEASVSAGAKRKKSKKKGKGAAAPAGGSKAEQLVAQLEQLSVEDSAAGAAQQ